LLTSRNLLVLSCKKSFGAVMQEKQARVPALG
jgi:hypothetical protein